MMRADNVDKMIETYAVMLNRAAWLVPERMDAQRQVWNRLIADIPGSGVVTAADVGSAITEMLFEKQNADWTVPPTILARAGRFARERQARVEQMIECVAAGSDAFMAGALSSIRRTIDAGGDIGPAIGSVLQAVRFDLAHSETDDDARVEVLVATERALAGIGHGQLPRGDG